MGIWGVIVAKIKGFKVNERQEQMLKELAEYMGTSESQVIRYLIWREYQRMKKEMVH